MNMQELTLAFSFENLFTYAFTDDISVVGLL